MVAQLVSRDAAIRLLEATSVFDRPVDTTVQMSWFTRVSPLSVLLAACVKFPLSSAAVRSESQDIGGAALKRGVAAALSRQDRASLAPHHLRRSIVAVPILAYHQIAVPPSRKAPFRSMVVHPEAFRRQMEWLKKLGIQGVSLREAMPYIRGEKAGKVAAITFDDSYANVHENALPVLQEFGFTATNFVVANQIGGSNVWDAPLASRRRLACRSSS